MLAHRTNMSYLDVMPNNDISGFFLKNKLRRSKFMSCEYIKFSSSVLAFVGCIRIILGLSSFNTLLCNIYFAVHLLEVWPVLENLMKESRNTKMESSSCTSEMGIWKTISMCDISFF